MPPRATDAAACGDMGEGITWYDMSLGEVNEVCDDERFE
jgi:hypothetical protein